MPIEIPWGLELDDASAHSKIGFLPLYIGADIFIVIDEEDYVWASAWRWNIKRSKNGKKLYACRTSSYGGRDISVFLHKEIALRSRGNPPTSCHIIADHMDGNSQNCRRGNLRWATPSMNRQNYHGIFAMQLRLDLKDGGDRLTQTQFFGQQRQRAHRYPPEVPTVPLA